MPPASLSTLEVIMPGPKTAAISARRAPKPWSGRRSTALLALHKPREHVLDVDDPLEVAELVGDGERPQVVLLEPLDDFLERRARRHRSHLAAHELGDRASAGRPYEPHERNDPEQLALVVDERDLVQLRDQVLVHLLEVGQGLPHGP